MLAPWPLEKARFHNEEAEYALDQVQKAVAGIRDLRARLNIPPAQMLKATISPSGKKLPALMTQFEKEIKKLGRLDSLDVQPGFKKSKTAVGNAFPDFEVFIHIEGILDTEKERGRIEKKIQETLRYVQTQKTKLSNENFVKNAPAEIVETEREKLADAEKVLKSHEELLELFK